MRFAQYDYGSGAWAVWEFYAGVTLIVARGYVTRDAAEQAIRQWPNGGGK